MTTWSMVVGLEVHTELKTKTKLFCSCPNSFGQEPNTNVCPICLGMPGSLPVLNQAVVEMAMKIGYALNFRVEPSVFSRKNYFYPDIPKGYQITQYDQPICLDGYLEIPSGKKIRIERAHIEEDTAKSTHIGKSGRIQEADYSLVDFNRSGVPLVEIVSAPDLRSAQEAKDYVEELRAVLIAVGVSDGKMEEGSMRVDANVSVRPSHDSEFGTRCEIKNLNSLRSLQRAITYEAKRQIALLEKGEKVIQQTRHWNEGKGSTSPLRSKEEAFDYRYFPEPDLVLLNPSVEWKEKVKQSLPILPYQKRQRLMNSLEQYADSLGGVEKLKDSVALLVDMGLDDFVVSAIELGADARLSLNRTLNEIAANIDNFANLIIEDFVELIGMEKHSKLSATQAKDVLSEMIKTKKTPSQIVQEKQYQALGDQELEGALNQVIASHPNEWNRYIQGEDKLAQFLLGQVMRLTKGRADAKSVSQLLAFKKQGEK